MRRKFKIVESVFLDEPWYELYERGFLFFWEYVKASRDRGVLLDEMKNRLAAPSAPIMVKTRYFDANGWTTN